MNAVNIVEEFWERVWKARNPAAIDDFVVDDFVLTDAGVDVVSKRKFKEWASAFMAMINDLQFEVIETFQNEDGILPDPFRMSPAATSAASSASSSSTVNGTIFAIGRWRSRTTISSPARTSCRY